MIIKTIALTSALVSGPIQQGQPAMRALTVPAHEHREPVERPEKTEPPHGEGSGESPMFGGMAVYGNVSNTASVTVSYSASGTVAYTSDAWLPNRFPLIVSSNEFVIVEREPVPTFPATIQIRPETKKHMGNLSARQIQRAVTRRQR